MYIVGGDYKSGILLYFEQKVDMRSLQGVVTTISPRQPGSKWNQVIKASICSESNDQESLKLSDQASK